MLSVGRSEKESKFKTDLHLTLFNESVIRFHQIGRSCIFPNIVNFVGPKYNTSKEENIMAKNIEISVTTCILLLISLQISITSSERLKKFHELDITRENDQDFRDYYTYWKSKSWNHYDYNCKRFLYKIKQKRNKNDVIEDLKKTYRTLKSNNQLDIVIVAAGKGRRKSYLRSLCSSGKIETEPENLSEVLNKSLKKHYSEFGRDDGCVKSWIGNTTWIKFGDSGEIKGWSEKSDKTCVDWMNQIHVHVAKETTIREDTQRVEKATTTSKPHINDQRKTQQWPVKILEASVTQSKPTIRPTMWYLTKNDYFYIDQQNSKVIFFDRLKTGFPIAVIIGISIIIIPCLLIWVIYEHCCFGCSDTDDSASSEFGVNTRNTQELQPKNGGHPKPIDSSKNATPSNMSNPKLIENQQPFRIPSNDNGADHRLPYSPDVINPSPTYNIPPHIQLYFQSVLEQALASQYVPSVKSDGYNIGQNGSNFQNEHHNHRKCQSHYGGYDRFNPPFFMNPIAPTKITRIESRSNFGPIGTNSQHLSDESDLSTPDVPDKIERERY